ncbi:hypothetical protein BDW68DRAFT_176977 [Aspergillus falconensis]
MIRQTTGPQPAVHCQRTNSIIPSPRGMLAAKLEEVGSAFQTYDDAVQAILAAITRQGYHTAGPIDRAGFITPNNSPYNLATPKITNHPATLRQESRGRVSDIGTSLFETDDGHVSIGTGPVMRLLNRLVLIERPARHDPNPDKEAVADATLCRAFNGFHFPARRAMPDDHLCPVPATMPPDTALGMCEDLYLKIHGENATRHGSERRWVGDGTAANVGGNAPGVVPVSGAPVPAATRLPVRSRPQGQTTFFVPALMRSSDSHVGEKGMGFMKMEMGMWTLRLE